MEEPARDCFTSSWRGSQALFYKLYGRGSDPKQAAPLPTMMEQNSCSRNLSKGFLSLRWGYEPASKILVSNWKVRLYKARKTTYFLDLKPHRNLRCSQLHPAQTASSSSFSLALSQERMAILRCSRTSELLRSLNASGDRTKCRLWLFSPQRY